MLQFEHVAFEGGHLSLPLVELQFHLMVGRLLLFLVSGLSQSLALLGQPVLLIKGFLLS
jgi:hypothetical protein